MRLIRSTPLHGEGSAQQVITDMNNPERYNDILTQAYQWLRRNIVRILTSSFLLVLAILIMPIVGGVIMQDKSALDDQDLAWQDLSISDEDNAFFLGDSLRAVAYEPTEPTQSITHTIEGNAPWDARFVRSITEKNKETCAIMHEASTKKYFQDPAFATAHAPAINEKGEVEIVWRKAARVCALRAIELAKQGDRTRGVALALDIVETGEHIVRAQGTTGNYLLGASVQLFGLSALRTIGMSTPLSRQEVRAVTHELSQVGTTTARVIQALKSEYLSQKLAVHEIEAGNRDKLDIVQLSDYKPFALLPYYFQPNRTLEEIASVYRKVIYESSVSCVLYEPYVHRRNLELPSALEAFMTRNVVGKLVAEYVMVPSTQLIERRCSDQVNIELTKLVLALSSYRAHYGVYPDSLKQLIPEYLERMPADPFSGEEFRYSKKRGAVASIGVKSERDANGVFLHNAKGFEFELKK